MLGRIDDVRRAVVGLLAGILAAGCGGPDQIDQRCVSVDDEACPSGEAAEALLEQVYADNACEEFVSVESGPRFEDQECCYDIGVDIVGDEEDCNPHD
jgi:hypothetical protein